MPNETASANEGGVEGIFHVKSFPFLVIAAISVNVPPMSAATRVTISSSTL